MKIDKKLFGRDIGMRSTFLKYDPCVTGPRSVECEECMVSLISDRFLGEKFTEQVLSKKYEKTKNLFTYVLIADTIGCDLNCWFCYAWKYLDLQDAKKIMNCFLSAKELAKQFDCKIRKTADIGYVKSQIKNKTSFDYKEQDKILKHINLELPFSRIRISGGEPIFSNKSVFQTDNKSEDLITKTIRYWIEFFEELDKLVHQIKKDKLINIATFDSDWQILNYPVWLTEAKDRIMIRFDTNGIIFGKEKFTSLFYSELLRLFKENKLNNTHIQIDYSFKGTTAQEFWWSQKRNLPATPKNNDRDIDLEKHLQIRGLKNIISNINYFVNKDSVFKDCVSITIEKGIDHDEKSKLWLYYPEALKWQSLADKLNIEFSDVVNYFDLNFRWRLKAKIHRYTKRGAMIELTNGFKTKDVTSTSIQDLRTFRKQNVKRNYYMTLVYPIDQKIELFKKEKTKPKEKVQISPYDQNFWIITGSEENLRIGLKHELWGVKKALETLWSSLKKDDLLFFYCTKPVSGIVGYAKVIDKHIDKKPFWPNEISGKESKYPLRIKFEKIHLVQDWNKDRKSLYGTGIDFYHGLNYIEPNKQQIILKRLEIKK